MFMCASWYSSVGEGQVVGGCLRLPFVAPALLLLRLPGNFEISRCVAVYFFVFLFFFFLFSSFVVFPCSFDDGGIPTPIHPTIAA